MKLSTLLNGVNCSTFKDVEIERVTDKDKEITENTLFICINGNRCDGHTMARKAVEKGAVAVLTEQDLKLENQITVKDTRKAYSVIAANFYGNPSKQLKLIGVTGTNGKTSTSFFIKNILEKTGVKCGMIGTVENDVGTEKQDSILTTPEPMELQKLFSDMVRNGCEYCVMEVSSQALAQERVFGLEFLVSVITNITPEHLDYHITMENYIDAKLSLLSMSQTAVVNIDDENIQENLSKIKCDYATVSTVSNSADYTAKNIICNENGIRYELVGIDCISRISSKLLGRFTVYNTLMAVTTLLKCGFDIDEAANAVADFECISGRAEVIKTQAGFTVLIDYAHTPDGLENILKSICEYKKGRLITVFGCGGDRDKSKRALMGKIAGELSDIAVVTSDNPRTENPILIINDILCGMERSGAKLAVIENRRQAIEFALSKAKKNDIVLLAGKGHETYQIIGTKKVHFDEREIVRDFLTK